jgi:hypothetical protein
MDRFKMDRYHTWGPTYLILFFLGGGEKERTVTGFGNDKGVNYWKVMFFKLSINSFLEHIIDTPKLFFIP